MRSTIITHGQLASRALRVELAKLGQFGVLVTTFEGVAARLAGGFTRPIDQDTLRKALQKVLPVTDLGELDAIKGLPGMVGAGATTLHKIWRAGIDLEARAGQPRIDAISALQDAVVAELPEGMLPPGAIVERARKRLPQAAKILGPIQVRGLTDMSPCWRPLLLELAEHVEVRWIAGPRHVPDWLDGSRVIVERSPSLSPTLRAISASTALHEAIEALRWARELITSGRAKPSEIAIAAASPGDYDDHFFTLRADANIDLKFVHGTSALASRDGQAAAALSEILVRGITHSRIRRLAALCRGWGLFEPLPEGWLRVIPEDAPMATPASWQRLFANLTAASWPDEVDHTGELRRLVETVTGPLDDAEEIGRAVLPPTALTIWRRGVEAGPVVALPLNLEGLRCLDDSKDAPSAVAWMPASALAAAPRPFVRLLGLTSRGWPRMGSDDRLLPDHVVPTNELSPLSIGVADRRDFETIVATTETELVLSRPRRDGEGRLLGKSPLLHGRTADETYLQRNDVPSHAMSEVDRLMARSTEFRLSPLARSAEGCWIDWFREEVTAHDGLIRAHHPMIDGLLDRMQSATSLKRLLRDPLGFVWRYGFGWKTPRVGIDPLTLDNREFGEILHGVLEKAVIALEAEGGLISADAVSVQTAIDRALASIRHRFEAERAVPPAAIWTRTLAEVRGLAVAIVRPEDEVPLPEQRSFAEVPFSREDVDASIELPWDPTEAVTVPLAGFRITGAIDRLNISGDGSKVRVNDYKTGRPPRSADEYVLDGGKEIQRALYAFAVKQLLGSDIEVEAALNFPRHRRSLPLANADEVLEQLSIFLAAARSNLQGGRALPGPDTAIAYNDLRFALPANAAKSWFNRKRAPATLALDDAAAIWEVK